MLTTSCAVDAAFVKSKQTAHALMAKSQEMLIQLPDELREEYRQLEKVRVAYDSAVAQAEQTGAEAPAPDENIDMRSMDELQTELEKEEANLEMNMNTNPGVVEQYEKRKRDVSTRGPMAIAR